MLCSSGFNYYYIRQVGKPACFFCGIHLQQVMEARLFYF
ncbi:hypothetical protein EPYR_03247 [Erwinia pyrifoliae DSM 12163]|nr:hypothetical protein EPYR_00490 [Erwinia pyrifoliae DSM 12163]CAY75627.1 hypothetical protein EPYR_03247 [Erwinia pyrifoliae DSM 12163]